MRGIQCEKSLWYSVHKPELEAEISEATQKLFDEGNAIGEKARELEGPGVLIEGDYWDFTGTHAKTEQAIKAGAKTIYEASFLSDNFYARADILKKVKNDWHLIEVKKATSVKDYYIEDAAIQTMIIEGSGPKLKTISIRFVNNEMVYPDFKNLFTTEDITVQVRDSISEMQKKVKKLQKIIAQKAEPEIEIGPHCAEPFGCSFKDHCWKKVPKKSVFDLPQMTGKKKWELFEAGKKKITDLDPKDYKGLVQRAVETTKSKKLFTDPKKIATALAGWKWPLYFFDFETINPVMPRYKGTSPYSQVPFQFSCHVWDKAESKKLSHFEYLHTDAADPRPLIIKAMLDGLRKKGSIVAYNKSFEIGVIKKLAEFDKKNSAALLALCDRFVDPLPVVRESVYHPDFLGSFSIKYVAPALIGEKVSYSGLSVADGSDAQIAAEQVILGKVTGKARDELIQDMLAYCRQDTLAMVEIFRWLMRQN